MKSISVTCPCGEVFERPVQRGRPAIWCPACRELPVAQRPERSAVPVVTGEASDPDRIVNENDKYDGAPRDQIEANVAAVYAEWPTVWGARENDNEADVWLTNALRDAYPAGHNKDRATVEGDD